MPSYSPVFSAAFITYTPSTPNNSFEVPTGYTAVVRQISCAQNIGGWYFELIFQDSTEAPGYTVALAESADVINYATLEGRWVLGSGGVMTLDLSELGSAVSAYVGGYLLRNTLS